MAAELVDDGGERVFAAGLPGGVEGSRLRLTARGVGERVRAALSVPPGPERLGALVELVTGSVQPAGRLSAREWVEVNVAVREVVSFCHGLQLVAVRELDRALDPAGQEGGGEVPAGRTAGRTVPPGRRAADELAPAVGMAPRTATCLVLLARRVEDELPAAAEALVSGRLDLTQVKVLDEVSDGLPAPVVAAVEAVAVAEGPRRTAAQLRTRLEAEAGRLDAGFASRAAARGVGQRDVRLTRSPLPGCRRLVADLPALHAVAAWNALNGAAVAAKRAAARLPGATPAAVEPAAGIPADAAAASGVTRPSGTAAVPVVEPEPRTMPQLRADLATALLTGVLTLPAAGAVIAGAHGATDHARSDGAEDAGGGGALDLAEMRVPSGAELLRYAEVHVVVAADTLVGATDLPAHLAGVGPLDPGTAREVAAVAPWRRLVADADLGTLVHRGPRSYPPPQPPAGTPLPPAEPLHGEVRPPEPPQLGPAVAAPPFTAPDPPDDGALADDPRWARLAVEPVSSVEELATPAYRPGQRLAAHVRTREQTCIGPACEHSTVGAEIDHTVNHGERGPDGEPGAIVAGNLGAACHRAHDAKTHGGWGLRQPTPGSFTWVSPTGRRYGITSKPLVPGWNRGTRPPRQAGTRLPDPPQPGTSQHRPPQPEPPQPEPPQREAQPP